MLKQEHQKLDIFIAILIIPGMILVANSAGISKVWGILAGLSSAALAAVFSTLNKKYISKVSVWHLSWIEMFSAWLTLGILLGMAYLFNADFKILPSPSDWFYLILLGFLCTTIAHAMSLIALKHISAFTLGLVINLEPIYGIILAAILLKEHQALNQNFYIGASLIMLAVFTYPFLKKRFSHAF
jgi:drug/metabolite transporter (DMT)-like permease